MITASQALKLFCDKFEIDFPEFYILEEENEVICECKWYKIFSIKGERRTSREEAVTSCLINLSEWVEKNTNFLNLIHVHNLSFMKCL